MANRLNSSHDVQPVVPSRSRTHLYNRSGSDVTMATVVSSQNNNNNRQPNKPPPVPRNSLIRSHSAQLYRQQQQQQGATPPIPLVIADPGNNNNNNNNVKSEPIAALSRSFTFESSSGVRRKIPVTPVLSTGPKQHGGANCHQANHDTLHYRHGTLVFPSSSSSSSNSHVIGKLTLDLSGVNNKNNNVSHQESLSSPTVVLPPTPPISPSSVLMNPLTSSTSMDWSLLKLCQDGDAGALSRYLSHHHDKVAPRCLNLVDSSGKTGLIHAAMTGNLAIARQLLRLSGLDINSADNEGNTALHLAAQAGHADIVSLLTLCPNLVIDIRNLAGLTALMKAALQGRVRCTRLLLLAGASPVLRDFGRGLCAAEWARLTGRTKCAEIIDKYMDKMQLNPGLGLKSLSVTSSEPSLIGKRSSLVLLPPPTSKVKDSWVKNTLKKAIRIVSGGSSESSDHMRIASTLTGGGVLGASVLLPGDPGRRSSLPVVLPTEGRSHRSTEFVVPRIQVSYWNTSVGGSIPPPPSTSPKGIPAEMRPQTTSRQRSKSTTRT